MRRLVLSVLAISFIVFSAAAFTQQTNAAQDQHGARSTTSPKLDDSMQDMQGMQHDSVDKKSEKFIDKILHHDTAGTSAQPNSINEPMIMRVWGKWMLMFHGTAFLNALQQSGPRGYDKAFSTNWFMPMAQRQIGRSQLTLRTMFSLEPATVTERFYPLLFQQGETAFGKPINDGQHPHDFFMELAALYDLPLGHNALLSVYAAPVGDPAMGPSAYAHRASASENPVATLGHHLQDSTHIADDVVTGGLAYKNARIEVSGFHGREPDEFRWDIDSGAVDSWSTRLTVQPGQNWSAQYSFAHLASPEQLHPGDDVQRMTASVSYNRPFAKGSWASTLLWGRNRTLQSGQIANGYLAESTLQFAEHNHVWTRIENVDRTSELLLGKQAEPPGFDEQFLARIQAYTAGYDHDFPLIPGLSTALGAQVTFYGKPDFLTPIYGQHPVGVILFMRVRPIGSAHSH
jgi:Ni/Co efflux regulator RcnB